MKKLLSLIILLIAVTGVSQLKAQTSKTDSFKVYGNCGMCKKRIERATAVDGITKSDWNVDTKMMTVTYDPTKLSNDAIQKKIAAIGHDTEKEKAVDSVYNKLPGCCIYDRKNAAKQSDHSGHHH